MFNSKRMKTSIRARLGKIFHTKFDVTYKIVAVLLLIIYVLIFEYIESVVKVQLILQMGLTNAKYG
jgi:hypothetical protein